MDARAAPPSRSAAALDRSDLAPIPPELDLLVMGLLSHDVLARPSSAGEVLDLLDGLLGTAAAGPSSVQDASARLPKPAFVGGPRERRSLSRQLMLAARGRAQRTIIEANPGVGRSRLLQELSLWSRISAATVLHVDAEGGSGFFGVASALALRLLDALPELATAEAAPFADSLALLSPRVASRLELQVGRTPQGFGELRVALQTALAGWFIAVARRHFVVVLVDNLERVDDGSLGFLLALAQAGRAARLMLVGAVARTAGEPLRGGEEALARASHRLHLRPLDESETRELLHSLFGDVEHLARLASRLHKVTRGNADHTLELAEQLVRQDVIASANGTWVLPREVPATALSRDRQEARVARLAALPEGARALGSMLSLRTGTVSRELAERLAESAGLDLKAQCARVRR